MTLEEAKKILEGEGFKLQECKGTPIFREVTEDFKAYERPEVVEAMRVVAEERYMILMPSRAFDSRKARLKKAFEEDAKEESEVKGPKRDDNTDEDPALEEAAKSFNQPMLDDQSMLLSFYQDRCKSYEECVMSRDEKIASYKKQFANLAKVLHKKNLKIEKLCGSIKDKDDVIDDISEELRRSKERNGAMVDSIQNYMEEVVSLRSEVFRLSDERDRLKKRIAKKANSVYDSGNFYTWCSTCDVVPVFSIGSLSAGTSLTIECKLYGSTESEQ